MKHHLRQPLPTLLLTTLLTTTLRAAPPATTQPDPTLQQIADQFRRYCLAPATDHGDRLLDDVELPKTSLSRASHLLQTQLPDGSWPDIDYLADARSSWQAYDHLTRLLAITLYARNPQTSPADSARALDAADRALNFWGKNDFKCPNWWYNIIGLPKILGTIALLLDKDLKPLDHDYITDVVMPRAKLGAMTGQNKVWIAGNNVMLALLTNDVSRMRRASGIIADEITVAKVQLGVSDEGIQPDWSFHQHGPQQQFGNYGLAFAIDSTRWAIILRNTRYTLPEPKLDILRNYVLDGLNWTCWNGGDGSAGGAMDISSCGRQLFPNSPRAKAATLAAVMQSLSQVDTAHAKDYTAFVARNAHNAPNDLPGTNFFYKSDYLISRSTDFMSTLKLHSNRVIGGETVNSEDLSGNHLADGATFFYRTADEYTDIFPLLNWRMIPGTTSLLDQSPLYWSKPKSTPTPSAATKKETAENPEVPPSTTKPPTIPRATDFVGGACDGKHAAIAFDFDRDALSAHKAYFYSSESGGLTLCLANSIASTSSALAVTTINQSLLHGDIRIDDSDIHPPTDYTGSPKTIIHDGLQYFFPQPLEINIHAAPSTGNWSSVFTTPATPKPDVTKDLFTLAIFHGIKPQNASYAYAVAPTTTLPSLKLLPENRIQILANNPDLQAARIDDTVYILFWTPGAFTVHADTIQVDHPCAILFTTPDNEPHLALADPTQSLKQLTLTLNGRPHIISLPIDQPAGSTVTFP